MTNNNPSINPADNGTLAGGVMFAFQKMMQNINGMLPAQVISYDRSANRAQVQILINIVGTDGQQYPRPQLASIPVFVFGGGGFRLSFPLESGSLGWVIANDRDISNFLQSYSQTAPNTARVKSFSDAVFFPDVMNGLDTIATADASSAVLQSVDGTVTIAISDNQVSITAPTKVNIDCPLVVVNPTIPGLFAVNGNITASGTITPTTPIPP